MKKRKRRDEVEPVIVKKKQKIEEFLTSGELFQSEIRGRNYIARKRVMEEHGIAEVKVKFQLYMLPIIHKLALMGATEKDFAEAFNISTTEWYHWRKAYPEVNKTVLEGKKIADANVAHAMYQVSLGYEHPEEVVFSKKVKRYNQFGKLEEETTEPEIVTIKKRYAPNGKTGMTWLARRNPEMWDSKKQASTTNILQINNLNLKDFTDEELVVLSKLGLDKTALPSKTSDLDYTTISDGEDGDIYEDAEEIIDDEE